MVKSKWGLTDQSGNIFKFLYILFVVFNNGEFKLLVGDVQNMRGMPAPVHRVLVDADIHNVLNILFDDLIVEFWWLVKNILDGAVDFKGFISFEEVSFIYFKSVLKLSK